MSRFVSFHKYSGILKSDAIEKSFQLQMMFLKPVSYANHSCVYLIRIQYKLLYC